MFDVGFAHFLDTMRLMVGEDCYWRRVEQLEQDFGRLREEFYWPGYRPATNDEDWLVPPG